MSMLSRLHNLWRGQTLDREFDEELRFHVEMREDANRRAGMSAEEAEAEARRHLGSRLRAREGMREARIVGWIDSLGRDLRHGARMFRRRPGLAALAVLTLSLGIGANATIFSLLNAILLRPLPFADAERLVAITDNFRTTGTVGVNPTVPELLDVHELSRNLAGVSFYDTRDFQLTGGDEPVRVFAARVEASFLTLLGVRPAHGRLFVAGEDRPGRDRVIVLGDGLWRRSFGADPAVVGRALMVNGAAHTVVGVLPPEFAFDYWSAEPIEMYVPFPMNPTYTSRSAEFASVRRVAAVARLKPRLSLQDASSELQAISQALTKEHPGLYRRGSDGQELGFFMDVRPLKDAVSAQSRPIVMLLFGGVGLVLLIACVNTVQFLLAQSIEREGEVAIRRALGAGRSRLVRQFLSEALLLAGAAAGVGLVQAAWLMKGLAAILPTGARVAGSLTVDLPVLVFTACTAMIATMACGIAPALHLSRSNRGLRREGSGTPPARSRSRQVLIAVEVAVSMVLLVGASVLVHSLRQLYNAPAGYSAEDVTVMRIRQPPRNVAPIGSVMYQRYLERIVEIPGVESAAVAAAPLPFYPATDFAIEGRPDDAAALSRQLASYLIVSPGYFSALRIPLRDGRIFAEDDIVGRPAVAIVNEEMARRFWPGESAVGRRIRAGQGPRAANLTIVGVVGNVRPVLQTGAVPQIYVSYLQQNEPSISLLVRRAPGATVSPDAVKQAVWSIAPDQPLFDIRPMTAIVSQLSAAPRTVALLLGSFALLALFMSATGVYTVVSYLMSQRTREIALRRAIGAGARDVLGLLAGQTFRWTFIGLVTGVAGAFAGSGALRAAVPGVVQVDPAAVLLVGAAYLAIVALAMCLPALKALRVDPAAVLRTE